MTKAGKLSTQAAAQQLLLCSGDALKQPADTNCTQQLLRPDKPKDLGLNLQPKFGKVPSLVTVSSLQLAMAACSVPSTALNHSSPSY